MLILQFILGHLISQLPSTEEISKYANRLLGAKALLALPHFVQEQYRHLMGEPLLLIEQLLIDLKVVKKIINSIILITSIIIIIHRLIGFVK